MNNNIRRGRTKPLQLCGCGCRKQARWDELGIMRGPKNERYYVLEKCRDEFTQELDAADKLNQLVFGLGGSQFWKRWAYRKMIFALQIRIHGRLMGMKSARSVARRSVAMFCLPKWMAVILANVWKRV